MTVRSFTLALAWLVGGGVLSMSQLAQAQDFPNRPIRVVTNQSAGGLSDVFMRAAAEQLHKKLGQPVVIENRPGGAGNIGARACQDAQPDGYTICALNSNAIVFNPHLFKKLPFDVAAIQPVTNMFHILQTIAVDAKLNVNTMDELIALSKAKPGTMNYSTPIYAGDLYMQRMQKEKGADWVRVPFRGGGEAVTGVLSGTTPITIIGEGNLISHVKADTIRMLVLINNIRSKNFPKVPTFKDIGYDGPAAQAWFGLFVPKGVPKAIVDRYAKAMNEIINEPAFLDRNLTSRSLIPATNSPEEFAKEIAQASKEGAQLVEDAGVPKI